MKYADLTNAEFRLLVEGVVREVSRRWPRYPHHIGLGSNDPNDYAPDQFLEMPYLWAVQLSDGTAAPSDAKDGPVNG